MSHITIIISKAATTEEDLRADVSYDYRIPVPHSATPAEVGNLVRNAYRHLEGHLVGSEDESQAKS